jgi:hypothetical protein
MKKILLLLIISTIAGEIIAQHTDKNKNALGNAIALTSDPIVFDEYFLFYQNLTTTSELGFDWIFKTNNPDSLEIRFIYINPNGAFTKSLGVKVNYTVTTIVAIDGKPTAKMTREEATNLMKGKPGTICEVTLRVKNDQIDELIKSNIRRQTFVNSAKNIYEKGIFAFKKAKIEEAIKYFSDYSYPESQIMLFKIYSGRILDEIKFTSQLAAPAYQKLRSLINADSVKKYSDNKMDNPTLTSLVSLYCYSYKFNTPNLTTAKNILTKKAADDGDVRSQELMAYLHAWHFNYDDMIAKDILPDKEQAFYWYNRAIAGGSKEGAKIWDAITKMKTSKDVYGIDLGRSRVFTFIDAKAVTKVAHLKHGLMGIIPDYISPFGVNGFENGVVYTDEKSHFPFTWSTHIIKNKDFALTNFEDALYVFKNQFTKSDFNDIEWYYIPEQDGNILKHNAAVFTAIENDAKSYKMQMGLFLQIVNGGYQIILQYYEKK